MLYNVIYPYSIHVLAIYTHIYIYTHIIHCTIHLCCFNFSALPSFPAPGICIRHQPRTQLLPALPQGPRHRGNQLRGRSLRCCETENLSETHGNPWKIWENVHGKPKGKCVGNPWKPMDLIRDFTDWTRDFTILPKFGFKCFFLRFWKKIM